MQDMERVVMVKTYFKYGDTTYWFFTPNWSPYGFKYDWWMGVTEEEKLRIPSRTAPGRVVDNLFVDELSTMYERGLKLKNIKSKINDNIHK